MNLLKDKVILSSSGFVMKIVKLAVIVNLFFAATSPGWRAIGETLYPFTTPSILTSAELLGFNNKVVLF